MFNGYLLTKKVDAFNRTIKKEDFEQGWLTKYKKESQPKLIEGYKTRIDRFVNDVHS